MALISSNTYLSKEEAYDNAKYIYIYFTNLGWTSNSICGMLGNIDRESTVNPGLWESLDYENYERGFGLVQWTPATNLTNWATSKGLDRNSIETQCAKIKDEYDNGGQYYPTDEFNLTFEQFSKSTESPEYLAEVFCNNYERPGVVAMEERKSNARYWYNQLSNLSIFIRHNIPENDNPFYNSPSRGGVNTCIIVNQGQPLDVLPNCVGAADGAFNETYVKNRWQDDWQNHIQEYFKFTADPPYTYNVLASNYTDYQTGEPIKLGVDAYPPLGGLMFWDYRSTGTNAHVAYISEVIDENTVITQDSAYSGGKWYSTTRTKQTGWSRDTTFLGFVYNPAIGKGPQPTQYPPEIIQIISVSSTRIDIVGRMNGTSLTTGVNLYIKWNSSNVSISNYDVIINTYGDFTISVDKPRNANSVAVLPVQLNGATTLQGSISTQNNLIVSIPCINIYTKGDMKQSIPYIYSNGEWKSYIPYIYSNGEWKSIYNDKK